MLYPRFTRRYTRSFFAGKRVIELGSGTGLVGIAMALLGSPSSFHCFIMGLCASSFSYYRSGARVVMTDLAPVLPLIRHNLSLNFPEGATSTSFATANHTRTHTIHTYFNLSLIQADVEVKELTWYRLSSLDNVLSLSLSHSLWCVCVCVCHCTLTTTSGERTHQPFARSQLTLSSAASASTTAGTSANVELEQRNRYPVLLARSLYTILLDAIRQLAGNETLVFVSYEPRIDREHMFFEMAAADFDIVEVRPPLPCPKHYKENRNFSSSFQTGNFVQRVETEIENHPAVLVCLKRKILSQ